MGTKLMHKFGKFEVAISWFYYLLNIIFLNFKGLEVFFVCTGIFSSMTKYFLNHSIIYRVIVKRTLKIDKCTSITFSYFKDSKNSYLFQTGEYIHLILNLYKLDL